MVRGSIDGFAVVFERCTGILANPIVVDRGHLQGAFP